MSGNPWSGIASGVSSGLTFIIKICEYTYALRAVDQQTKEYLITAQHAWTNIKTCRELLGQQKEHLPASERKDYERVIEETRRAAEEVALLLEPARVDLEADCSIHFSTRVMWVLSDNSNIAAALKRLDIVHTTLTQNISTLRLLRTFASGPRERPPSYQTSQKLQWKRQTRITPKPSTDSFQNFQIPRPSPKPQNTRFGRAWSAEELPTETNELDAGHRADSTMSSVPSTMPTLVVPVITSNAAVQGGTECFELESNTLPQPSPTLSDRKPRTWLEYQATKASLRRKGKSLQQKP
ncbi:hypothetical protein EDD37DRAFT_651434 [Exophiala viscosa]|uniref:Fungal N-terminal domain-containing protein n=1 Tax=Exophiala viscosa TaxID=2486360 RepID=A0AAN6DV95_9EURO|nr:hypothetical protein EDD36DRAFT_465733 [Exophiala viscosa]KAI1623258.1 hypothetical protein EDD37DRAFT_651434 [Exophiala viscosa]